jgi:hypothetical protein
VRSVIGERGPTLLVLDRRRLIRKPERDYPHESRRP